MTLVPSNTRFVGFSQLANLDERKSEFLNSISQPFSMQDIAGSSGNFEAIDPYYNNPSIKVEIETTTQVWLGSFDGPSTPTFMQVDLIDCSSLSIDFSIFSFAGFTQTGTYSFSYNAQVGSANSTINAATSATEFWQYGVDISYNIVDNIVSFYLNNSIGEPSTDQVEILYTLKKYKLPMRLD